MLFVAELCKGSTADSDSVCLGSNPSSAAKSDPEVIRGRLFTNKFSFVMQKNLLSRDLRDEEGFLR